MNERVAELPWSDEQWSKVSRVVADEAQQTRVAARFLPVYGPIDAKDVAVPNLALSLGDQQRLEVDSLPGNVLTTISVLVHVRMHEAADPELQAALTMFRRAANLIARTEDALMFNGQPGANQPPPGSPQGPLAITGGNVKPGLMDLPGNPGEHERQVFHINIAAGRDPLGQRLISSVVEAINRLEDNGYHGPYACVLASDLYQAVHTPTDSLALPRHAILPLLEDGLLLRSSSIAQGWGLLVSYGSGQVEQVLARDIHVKFLQVSLDPRFVFRVSERLSLRVKDWQAVANLRSPRADHGE